MIDGPVSDKASRVQAMFARIAPRYDLMNALMTGGRDRAWRRTAARVAAPPAGSLALDLATGTGDLALALLGETRVRGVVGVDFVEGMLRLGQVKLGARGERRVRLLAGDALALPFADASFGCVGVGLPPPQPGRPARGPRRDAARDRARAGASSPSRSRSRRSPAGARPSGSTSTTSCPRSAR